MPDNHTGSVLAFIGDALLSLQVREYLVSCGYTKAKDLQEKSTDFVSAKAQAKYIQYLIDDRQLSPEEYNIFKRGRNDKSTSIAKNADVITYRYSTGFEALWGYLYLQKNTSRIEELWEQYKLCVDQNYAKQEELPI